MGDQGFFGIFLARAVGLAVGAPMPDLSLMSQALQPNLTLGSNQPYNTSAIRLNITTSTA